MNGLLRRAFARVRALGATSAGPTLVTAASSMVEVEVGSRMAVASGPREVALYSGTAQFRFTPPVEVLGAGSGEVVGHLGPDQLHLEVAPRTCSEGAEG